MFNIRKPIIPTRPPIPEDKKFPNFGKARPSQSHESEPEDEGEEMPDDDALEEDWGTVGLGFVYLNLFSYNYGP